MNCPYCGHDNIQGIDACEQCLMDLQPLDEPAGATPIEDSLIREPVSVLGPKKAVSVAPDATIAEVIEVLVEQNIGCVLVEEDGELRGILSERDLLLRVSEAPDEMGTLPVSELMTRHPETLEETTPLAYALNKMSVGDFRHLPLTRGGSPSGIVSLRDFLGFVFRWYPEMAADG